MLYRKWVQKPQADILPTDDDTVQIRITAAIMNSAQLVMEYDETITIPNENIVDPSDVYGVVGTYVNDWTIQKEAELP
tara:strand:+ start:2538 stop:2771 length:234 start_codon:yes stop_codon:yes gene_type:complete